MKHIPSTPPHVCITHYTEFIINVYQKNAICHILKRQIYYNSEVSMRDNKFTLHLHYMHGGTYLG